MRIISDGSVYKLVVTKIRADKITIQDSTGIIVVQNESIKELITILQAFLAKGDICEND